jgi:hypothetical protein
VDIFYVQNDTELGAVAWRLSSVTIQELKFHIDYNLSFLSKNNHVLNENTQKITYRNKFCLKDFQRFAVMNKFLKSVEVHYNNNVTLGELDFSFSI